jgi:hypothetical protein
LVFGFVCCCCLLSHVQHIAQLTKYI